MNLPAKPIGFAALSQQQQEDHRAKIGGRVTAILGQFWHDTETPDAIRALEIEGWCDVLENCSHSEIRTSWTAYQKNGPRTQAGKLCKPDAGALYQIILRARPKPQAIPKPEPERIKVATKEQREKIMRMVKYRSAPIRD